MPYELFIFSPFEGDIPRLTSHAVDGTHLAELPGCRTVAAEQNVHVIGVVDVRHN